MEMELNMLLATTTNVSEVTRFASDISYLPYNPIIEKLAIASAKKYLFLNINPNYLESEILNSNNNLIVLYTYQFNDKIHKPTVRVECIVTYREIRVKVGTKYKQAIYLTALVVSRLPKENLSLSGGDIMNWFYEKMKEAGGYAIKISAIDTAIPFWNEKMKFIFDNPVKNSMRKTLRKKMTTIKKTGLNNQKTTKKWNKKMKNYMKNYTEMQMRRVRSDGSRQETPHTAEDSWSKIDEIL